MLLMLTCWLAVNSWY